MATEFREKFNQVMRDELRGVTGTCLYIGNCDDDKEMSRYRDYGSFSDFRTLDILGNPDFQCSIEKPIGVHVFDTVLMCWVLEHVRNPYAAMFGALSLTRSMMVVAYPVSYRKHPDPVDIYRFLPGYTKQMIPDSEVYREFEIKCNNGDEGRVDFVRLQEENHE
jgi:hypothetical protein